MFIGLVLTIFAIAFPLCVAVGYVFAGMIALVITILTFGAIWMTDEPNFLTKTFDFLNSLFDLSSTMLTYAPYALILFGASFVLSVVFNGIGTSRHIKSCKIRLITSIIIVVLIVVLAVAVLSGAFTTNK